MGRGWVRPCDTGPVRVVAGTARGRRLRAPAGLDVRPTLDRVREAVFNSLDSLGAVRDATVLDLFAGSGALGIEALSRGARGVTFVDDDRRSVAAVGSNLSALDMQDRAVVVRGEVFATVGSDRARGPFDLVLADPPYAFDRWPELVGAVADVIAPGGLLVAESDRELDPGVVTAFPERRVAILRQRSYGGTVVAMLTFDWSPPVPPASPSGEPRDPESGS